MNYDKDIKYIQEHCPNCQAKQIERMCELRYYRCGACWVSEGVGTFHLVFQCDVKRQATECFLLHEWHYMEFESGHYA